METNTLLTISFIVYSVGIVLFGLYSTKAKKDTTDDFVLANRELGPWASSLSASASSESGWVMLGLVGETFVVGLSTIWILFGIGVGYMFNWFIIAERLRKFTTESGAVTLPQYISHRFDKNSKALIIIPVIIIVAAMLGYVAAQMNAAGKAFDAVFHLPYWIGVIAGAVIILTYTVTGGFRAICWTDIIQAFFMVIALIFMPFVVLNHLDGLSTALDKLNAMNPGLLTFTGQNTGFTLLGFILGMFGIGFGYPGQPQILARFMAAKDTKSVKRAGMIAFIWFLLVYIGAILFGLFARAYFGTLADPEQALPFACSEFLPPILGGFVIAAIVAAICSTADSQLIVISTTFSRDIIPFFKKNINTDNSASKIKVTQSLDRWILIILAIISVFFALTENRLIFEFVLYAWSAMGAAFGPVIILGLLWKKANKAGAIAAMVTGALVTVIWRNIPILKSTLYELVPAFVLAFLAMIIFSLFFKENQHES